MRSEEMRALVAELCSKECAGRKTGSDGSRAARGLICGVLDQIGLEPAGQHRYLQHVPASNGENILARLPGSGKRADRAILVAAHYDHVGPGYPGADDNAAAVAILADTARRLTERAGELERQVIFAWFDGEEPPYFLTPGMGSVHFVNSGVFPVERIDLMICMDLMGHALGSQALPEEVRSSVFALGAEKSRGTAGLVDEIAARASGVKLRRAASDVIPTLSDYAAFEEAGVPYVFLSCGRWVHYHQPTDTPEKLDYRKMVAASDALVELTIGASARPVERVEWLPEGRDDRATLASLAAIATAAEPLMPRAARAFLGEVEALGSLLDRSAGVFKAPERRRVEGLVAMLESALAG